MIRFRHLRLRVFTANAVFGADVPLEPGLNIIQAHNTSGKSTALQAIIYALGLERSLGPQLAIPLPYAMRERIHARKDDPYELVLQSYVELHIENEKGQMLLIRRDVVGGKETKLIQTWSKGTIADYGSRAEPRDFFVHDPGSAQREDGFYRYLESFIGWKLPTVTRFDGSEGQLYLEALFPMFFVEQKRGWSTVQGPFPTFLKIQDVTRRVLEFVLNLDAGRILRQRAEIGSAINSVNQKWETRRKWLEEQAERIGRMRGIPIQPSAEFALVPEIKFEVYRNNEWQLVSEATRATKTRIRELEKAQTPTTEEVIPKLLERMDTVRQDTDAVAASLEVLRSQLFGEQQEERGLRIRLASLRNDLTRNQDALKLKRLGSSLGRAAGEQVCPTCHQDVTGELLPSVEHLGMGLEENIAFVKSQIELYETALRGALERLNDSQGQYRSKQDELREKQAELRSLRQAMVQPNSMPTRVVIEEIVRTQSLLDKFSSFEEVAAIASDELQVLAQEWSKLQDALRRLPSDELTFDDKQKIGTFQSSIQSQLEAYGFVSFLPTEIVLSQDNFRPLALTRSEAGEEIEKEINFEVSASDGIRLKWAYYLSLLSIASNYPTNHAGVVIFDEPGQQEIEVPSLHAFLRQAAKPLGKGLQVIVSTSEPLISVRSVVSKDAHVVTFDGFMLQPINNMTDS